MTDLKLTRLGQCSVMDAFWSLVLRRAPLTYGRDRVFVSLDAWPWVRYHLGHEAPFAGMIFVDDRLRGIEMRLEHWSWRIP